MENFSRLISPLRQPWAIEIYPHLYDHHFEDKAVFPAAEVLIELARVVKINFPQASFNNLADAYFPRFLAIPVDAKTLTVSVDLEEVQKSRIRATLLKYVKSPAGSISRAVQHARVEFAGIADNQTPLYPFGTPGNLEGDCIKVPSAAIYSELVPFGRAYQNISGELSISRAGALASISGGGTRSADELLGSPFPFDAILHMACVWAQRFTDVVPFPSGFAKRTIYQKTKNNVTYLGRIVPITFTGKQFVFDAWIFNLQGSVCEVIEGIQMVDVSRGRMRPPAWIKKL
jgi:hypothetical protein